MSGPHRFSVSAREASRVAGRLMRVRRATVCLVAAWLARGQRDSAVGAPDGRPTRQVDRRGFWSRPVPEKPLQPAADDLGHETRDHTNGQDASQVSEVELKEADRLDPCAFRKF